MLKCRPLKLPSLLLPADQTVAFVIDPLRDFMEKDGAFARRYGFEDIRPLYELVPELRYMIASFRSNAMRTIVLCNSFYKKNQCNVPGLENLCTTRRGRQSVITPEAFSGRLTKTAGSIFSADKKEVSKVLCNVRHAILTGVTGTSCIRESVQDIAAKSPSLHIVVPRNAVASRTERKEDEDAIFEKWENPSNISVVDSWKDISFHTPKTNLPPNAFRTNA